MIGPREKFRVVLLNNRSVIIRDETISTGNHNMTLVDPREVFIAALRGRAAGILVMHNHPSGDPEPGHEDIETTKRLLKAGEILGIKLYDHIIFGGDAYYSVYEQGMMDKIRSEER